MFQILPTDLLGILSHVALDSELSMSLSSLNMLPLVESARNIAEDGFHCMSIFVLMFEDQQCSFSSSFSGYVEGEKLYCAIG